MTAAMLTLSGCCKSRGGDEDPGELGSGAAGATGAGRTPSSTAVESIKRKAMGELPVPAGPVMPPNKKAGPAYVGTSNGSLIKLENGSFSRVLGKLGWVNAIATAADGTLWVASASQIHEVKNGKKRSFRGKDKARQFKEIALDAQGRVWLTGLYGVSRFEKGSWKTFLKDEIVPGMKGSVGAMEVDAKGRVWIVGSQHIAWYDGSKWSALSTKGTPGDALFCHGAALGDKALYTVADGGIVKISSDGWFTLRSSERLNGNELALGPDGSFFVADYKSVSRVKEGSPVAVYEQGEAFKGKHVKHLTADAQGRAWFITEAGLTVLDAQGKVLQWEQGTEPMLVEKVSAIYVEGSGPKLPDAVGEVKKGTVRGKLTRGGVAAAGVPVEICASPRMMYSEGESPCHSAPVHKSGSSGTDGTFVFTDVPIGSYGVAHKAGPKWTITLGTSYCADMKAGGTCTIPPLDVNR